MLTTIRMSTSESEDENLQKLQSAVDPTLLQSSLYGKKEEEKVKNVPKDKPKTLRRDLNPLEEQNISDLEVTPEFQTFVAAQLDKMLEQNITEVERKIKKVKRNEPETGIKLLKSSLKPVDLTPIVHHQKRPDLLAHRKEIVEDDERLREVAVTPESILSQEGIQFYANKFASRVEPGIERIKKKKKKKDKKKKSENPETKAEG
ncbi:uncharacterized protein LOC111711649 [Eurytemora carolleeae]|uniref:uncharacterized protein LOC111711649 n=1 Tax=Eurytemora carolleeae TaxID=1294199 RepID=UPI000C78BEAA|nr:uncharacterized protein LOC111711649 [Eurytemora carolleeae]|eukprot:XP_023341809.1 uncharacterized protein LOC111711649 [Eurytemora affinis]